MPHRLEHVLDGWVLSGVRPFLVEDRVSVLQAFLTSRRLVSLPSTQAR